MEAQLSRLESKIQETIERTAALQRDNTALERRNAELEAAVMELRSERDRLRSRLDEADSAAALLEEYQEKHRLVEAKVGNLLDKLEAMG